MRKFLSLLVAAVVGVGVAVAAKKLLGRAEKPGAAQQAAVASQRPTEPTARPSSASSASAQPVRKEDMPTLPPILHFAPDATPQQPLTLSGYVKVGRRINVLLSDGRTLTERDGHVCQFPAVVCDAGKPNAKCVPQIVAMERNGVRLKDNVFVAYRTIASQPKPKDEPKAKDEGEAAAKPTNPVKAKETPQKANPAGQAVDGGKLSGVLPEGAVRTASTH